MIAAGLGCRKDCPVDDILGAVMGAAERAGIALADIALFCAPAFKTGEASLVDAAKQFQRPLVFFPQDKLDVFSDRAQTQSARVRALTNLPSVAETAALAGVPAPSRLLGPRFAYGGATCALAMSEASS